jgi:aspartyl-tRNA(Asn)/glutamyl-tRNA(Gln) amidotransferase subunit C
MADLRKEDVLKLARLARLHLTNTEIEQFREEISAILKYVEQLQTIDTEGLEPTYQVTGLKNVMREDEPGIMTDREEWLKNAPAIDGGHFKVKRMVE